MDGTEILEKMKTVGYVPTNNKEREFVNDLYRQGYAYKEKEQNCYKLLDTTMVEDGIEKITLYSLPQVKYLGLFIENNNFITSLSIKPQNIHIQLNYLGALKNINYHKLLSEHNLGEEVSLDIVGFGISDNNEGYLVELPTSIKDLFYYKDKKPCFTVGLSKYGKEKDTSALQFKPIRRSKVVVKLGICTSQGIFYNIEELENAKLKLVIDKTNFYN